MSPTRPWECLWGAGDASPFAAQLITEESEILDDEGLSERGLRILTDLARWNRLSGWENTHVAQIERWWRALGEPRPFRLLDVGTGPGELLGAIARWGEKRNIPLDLHGVDRSPAYVAAARANVGARATVHLADATDLPFGDQYFDLATTTLMLHHLPGEVRSRLVTELGRTCRGLYLFDLERTLTGAVGWALLAPLLAMGSDTRHDGVVSVRKALTRGELVHLVAPLGLPVERTFPTGLRTAPPQSVHSSTSTKSSAKI